MRRSSVAACVLVWIALLSAAPAAAVKLPAHPVWRALDQRARQRDSLRDATPVIERERAPTTWTGGPPALGPDAIVNDRSLSACPCSGGLPSMQSESSLAAYGPYVVVSWNERRGTTCPSGTGGQGHAWSIDHGASFREGALLSDPTVSLRGDPTVAVNAKNGDWFISGLSTFGGVGVVRGRFSGPDFVIDLRRALPRTAGYSYDKPWMAVDSLSGTIFVTWTRFTSDQSSTIELQRLDRNLNPLGPVQELRYTPPFPDAEHGAQLSFQTIGPNGELYVGWHLYSGSAFGREPSFYEVVRSDDFGQTFGPVRTIAEAHWAIEAAPTGFQRGFWPGTFAMAVDHSHGPHRGRVYACWSETVDLSDLVLGGGATVDEVENNDFFASATPFVPGDVVRGSVTAAGSDFYRFHGTKGQVFAYGFDTTPAAVLDTRLLCPRDTAGVASYHALSIASPVVVGLPYDGDYYLQIHAPIGGSGSYQFSTALDPPTPGQRARDIRDAFVAWSDDGVTWSTPVRVNDEPAGVDGVWAQVAVDGRGRVHAFWLDWRDDPVCGVISEAYMASSGDGGVTWGPNRKITDSPSFWGLRASCSPINLGDYMQMAAVGDRVYASFPDARHGDPDVFLDVSRFASESSCPADRVTPPASTVTLDFSLVNRGNFDTPLAWRVSDSAGWLTGATPAADGSQALAPDGAVVVQATLMPPEGSTGDSTFVRFVTHDPHVPGAEDTCVAVVRCDVVTAVLPTLLAARVQGRDVSLRWHGDGMAGAPASVSRRPAGGEWAPLGRVRADASGVFVFVDRGLGPGRYVYRLTGEGDDGFVVESPVEVPALALSVERAWSEGGRVALAFVLASSRPAVLELVDVAGRTWIRDELSLEAGAHEHRLATRRLPGGVYVVRLTQDGATVSTKAIIAN